MPRPFRGKVFTLYFGRFCLFFGMLFVERKSVPKPVHGEVVRIHFGRFLGVSERFAWRKASSDPRATLSAYFPLHGLLGPFGEFFLMSAKGLDGDKLLRIHELRCQRTFRSMGPWVVFTGLAGFDGIDGVHIWDLTGYQRDAAQDSVHWFCFFHLRSSASLHYMSNI